MALDDEDDIDPLLRAESEIEESPAEHETAPGWFLWALTLSAGLSGLLFGYDTGVISAALVSIGSDLTGPLSTADKSVITACTSLFALIASPVAGLLADRFGRRRLLVLADILFIGGAICQAATKSRVGMVLGRSVVGLAVGGASFVVPLYISELAPARYRGRLVTVSILFITFGQVVAYVVGHLLASRNGGWRSMLGLGALPGCVQLLTLVFLPETPRWLVSAGQKKLALAVLERIHIRTGPEVAGRVLRQIERECAEQELARRERKSSRGVAGWTELWNVPGNRRALAITCMLQGLQQLCGFNSLMYFSASIFAMVGFADPTSAALCVAVTNFIFTLVAFVLIDRAGRRRMLLFSIPIMVVGLFLCAVAFRYLDLTPAQISGSSLAEDAPPDQKVSSVIILIAMTVYVGGYAIGLGNVPWQQSELFPLSVRSLGSSLATATNWASNFVVGITFLPMMAFLSPSVTFGLYALVCVVGWGVVWKIYPETVGLTLEEVGLLLQHGWGV